MITLANILRYIKMGKNKNIFDLGEVTIGGGTSVDTPDLLKLQADRCAILGTKGNPLYPRAVKQLEILAIGSGQLKNEYYEAKEKLLKKKNKALKDIFASYNHVVKNSRLNNRIEMQKEIILDQFNTDLHNLLMKTLSPIFYKKVIYEDI